MTVVAWCAASASFALLLVLVACEVPEKDRAEAVLPDATDALPSRPDTLLEDTVLNRLSVPAKYEADWYQPDLMHWEPYVREQYSDSTGDVSHRRADLDGDGRMDAAFFLRSRVERKDSMYAVVVVFGTGADTLLGVFSWAEAMGTIGAGLHMYPPRTMHHLGSERDAVPSPVALRDPSVALRYFEKSEVTWVWQAGSFHRIWTAD